MRSSGSRSAIVLPCRRFLFLFLRGSGCRFKTSNLFYVLSPD